VLESGKFYINVPRRHRPIRTLPEWKMHGRRWQKNWEKERPVCIANLQTRTSHVDCDKKNFFVDCHICLFAVHIKNHVFSLKYLTHIGLYADSDIDLWSDNNFMYY